LEADNHAMLENGNGRDIIILLLYRRERVHAAFMNPMK